MINQENNDLYDLNKALKVENLTLNDYEEICERFWSNAMMMVLKKMNRKWDCVP